MDLFDENEHYTDEARKLDFEVIRAITPIVEEWEKKGCKTREIQDVLHSAVSIVCMQRRAIKLRDKHKNGNG